MRVETNWVITKRNRTIARYLFFFSFGVLILGLFVINGQAAQADPENAFLTSVLPFLMVVFAFVTTVASVRMTNLWVKDPRPEDAIREGLKGISNKAVFYNYYHFPTRHLLVTPQGVFAIHAPFQDGTYVIDGDRWGTRRTFTQRLVSLFRFDSIGDPFFTATKSAQHAKSLLEPHAPDIEVQPLVVFVDPRAQFTAENPKLPVLYADDKNQPNLKKYLRDLGEDSLPTLTAEQIQAFEEATLPPLEDEVETEGE